MLTNPEVISNSYVCGKLIANLLIDLGFPLLGRKGNNYYFAKTEHLLEELTKLPFYIKWFNKIL